MDLDSAMMYATLDLAERSGTSRTDVGYVEKADEKRKAGWYMVVAFDQGDVWVSGYPTPDEAAYGMARRLLRGATCRCGKTVTVGDLASSEERAQELARPVYFCQWRLLGREWVPGCDVKPVRVKGRRGDHEAMRRAMDARRVDP